MPKHLKIHLSVLIFALFVCLFAVFNFAAAVTVDFVSPTIEGGVKGLIGKILGYFLAVGSIIATGSILYAAYLFITSGGDPSKITQAKNIIIWTIVGVALLAVSYSVPNLISNILGQ